MIVIICMFAGLLLIVSGNDICVIINNVYVPLVCNIFGCGLMCYGAYMLWDNQRKEKQSKKDILAEIKHLLERIPDATEQKEIETVIKQICDSQMGCKEVAEELATHAKLLIEFYSKSHNTIIEYLDNIEEKQQNVSDSIIHVFETQGNSINKFEATVEEQFINGIESIKNLQKQLKALQKDIHEDNTQSVVVVEKIEQSIKNVGEKQTDKIDDILQAMSELQKLPQEVSNQVERVVAETDRYSSTLLTRMVHLSEDLEEQDGLRTKNFNKMLGSLTEYCENNNEEILEQISILSQQYIQFEKTVEAIVEKMTHMAEEDIEVMKGFING